MSAAVAHLTDPGDYTAVSAPTQKFLDVAVPANVADQDMLVCILSDNLSTATPNAVTGWSQVGTINTGRGTDWVMYHLVDEADDEPASYEFSTPSGQQGGRWTGLMFRVTGADHTHPIDAVGAWAQTANGPLVFPAVAAVDSEALLVAIGIGYVGGTSMPVFSANAPLVMGPGTPAQSSGNVTATFVATQTLTNEGSTGTRQANHASGGTTTYFDGFMFTIRPKRTSAFVASVTRNDQNTVNQQQFTVPAGVLATDVAIVQGSSGAATIGGARTATSTNGNVDYEEFLPATAFNNGDAYCGLLTGVEAGETLTLHAVTGSGAWTTLITWYRGYEITGYTVGTKTVRSGSGLTCTAVGVTTAEDGDLVLCAFFDRSASSTSPRFSSSATVTGPVDHIDAFGPGADVVASGGSCCVTAFVQDFAGATTTAVATMLGGGAASTNGYGFQVILKQAEAPAAVLTKDWVSRFQTHSLTVAAKVANVTSGKAIASTSSDMSDPIEGSDLVQSAAHWCYSVIEGLDPNTEYYVAWQFNEEDMQAYSCKGKTLYEGVLSYVAGTGSCQGNGTNPAIFDQIAADNCDFLIHQGDIHYADTSDESTWRNSFMAAVTASHMSGMLAQLGMDYGYDNHDWAGQGSDASYWPGAITPATMTRELASDDYPASSTKELYHTFVHGRVRWIRLDQWSTRDPDAATNGPDKRFLSDEQETWLYDTLTAATEPLIILCSNWPLYHNVTGGRWQSYPDQTNRIKAWITARPWIRRRMVGIGGDSHNICADNGTSQDALGLMPTLNASAFMQSGGLPGGTWSIGNILTPTSHGVYSRVTITDSEDSLHFLWEAVEDTGDVLMSWSRTFGVPVMSKWDGAAEVDMDISYWDGETEHQVGGLTAI